MTAVLLVVVGVLAWPFDSAAGRVRALVATGRLRGVGSGQARRPGWPVVSSAGIGRLAVCVVVGVPTAGAIALVEALGLAAAAPLVTTLSVLAGCATLLGRGRLARRRGIQADRALDSFVGLLAAELDAGTPADRAWTLAAAAAGVAAPGPAPEVVPGGPGPPAGERRPAVLDALAVAWSVSASTGAPLSKVVARVRDDLAETRSTRRLVETVVAGPRASAAMLAALPGLGLALGTALGANPTRVLIDTSAGRVLMCVGVLFDAAGLLWTDAMIKRASAP